MTVCSGGEKAKKQEVTDERKSPAFLFYMVA